MRERPATPPRKPLLSLATAAMPVSPAWRMICCCAPISRPKKATSWQRPSPKSSAPTRQNSADRGGRRSVRPFLTLHHPAVAQRYYAAGLWRAETLHDLLTAHTAARPEAVCALDGRRKLTWAGLAAWVDGIAAWLRGVGLSQGEAVSIWMSNRLEAVATFLACSREGFAC